ncbi:UNKNOWN [Stylonychia lemnae]|uniref:PHR domain-containing protein n=1 Tax=Stylonychia lemnae TaxID=5949 RepID=A0A078BB66_STYLE|nr:UNKNOWN [Stylonychia lemnae]|eukprot:CDW91634.1 UNKNOWN [Stylonychia lemnae]
MTEPTSNIAQLQILNDKTKEQQEEQLWREVEEGDFYMFERPLVAMCHENDEQQPIQQIIKKQNIIRINKKQSEFQVKPGQMYFSSKYGYVRTFKYFDNKEQSHAMLTFIDEPIWECIVLQNNMDKKEKTNEQQIVTLLQNDLRQHIQLDLVIHVDDEIYKSEYRVDILKKTLDLIRCIEKLYQIQAILLYKNKRIVEEKTFQDQNIQDKAQILVLGSYHQKSHTIGSDIRRFKRFSEIRVGDSWYVGKDRWDGIVFQPKQSIQVHGIGIYMGIPEGQDFQICYKYHIEDQDGNNVMTSDLIEESVVLSQLQDEDLNNSDHIIWYKFQSFSLANGILVRKDHKFNIQMWVTLERCYYSESGSNYNQIDVNEDMDLFSIYDSQYCTNSTRVNRGIFPGIIYSL